MRPALLGTRRKAANPAAGAIPAGCIIARRYLNVESVLAGHGCFEENFQRKLKAFFFRFATYYPLWYVLTFYIHAQ